MKLTKETKLYVLPDGKFITLADIWRTEREQILQDQKLRELLEESVKQIEDYCDNDDGVACTPSLYGLQKILRESKE